MAYRNAFPNATYGHLMPPEDATAFTDGVFAVADGITRDPSYNLNFKKKSIESLLKKYPNPSGARRAADIFCETFLRATRNRKTMRGVAEAFLSANRRIGAYNRQAIGETDYLVRDLYGCVASGAVIRGKTLTWGVIGDCGIAVFSKTGRRKLRSPNSVEPFERHVASGAISFKWETAEGRRFVREGFRNKPDMKLRGERVSYGALTGERNAEPFMYFGSCILSEGDTVVLYTDGFAPHIERKDFFPHVNFPSESLIDQHLVPYAQGLALKEPKTLGKERSLIITRV